MARYYDSRLGSFASADPLRGRVGDPQSWNRYAYVQDDPVVLTDSSGQGWLSDLFDAIAALFGFVHAFQSVPVTTVPTFPSGPLGNIPLGAPRPIYNPMDVLFPPNPARLQTPTIINNPVLDTPSQVFAAECQQSSGCDPEQSYDVTAKHINMAWNVESREFQVDAFSSGIYSDCVSSLRGGPVYCGSAQNQLLLTNPSAYTLTGYFKDPINSFHQGNASYYSGFFLNDFHLVVTGEAEGHLDPFGPLNPLHYLLQLPSKYFTQPGPAISGTCMAGEQCTWDD